MPPPLVVALEGGPAAVAAAAAAGHELMDWRRPRRIQAELLLLSRDRFQGSDFHASVPLGLQIANGFNDVFPST